MPKLNHDAKIGFVLNDFTNLRDDELSLLIKLKYDKYIEYCKHGKSVFCNKSKVDNKQPICHSRNHTFLVSRYNRVVNAIIDGIKSKRVPRPVGRRNNNLPANGKIPDVEF